LGEATPASAKKLPSASRRRVPSAPWVKIAVPSKPPSRTSRLLPRPTSSSGSSWRNGTQEIREVVEVGREKRARRGAAGAPRHVPAIGSPAVIGPRSSAIDQLPRHAADGTGAHGDHHVAIRAAARIAAGMAAMSSTKMGSTFPATRSARTSERAVGGDDRCLAGGIDFPQQQRIDDAQHLDEILEAIARARVAVRLESQHQAPAGKGAARSGQRRRHFHRVMAVVVDQREVPAAGQAISP
jgi:hypothetical protein